ncbi:MAG TPA: hypothetical protein PLW55_01010 [Leptospiraceae bacterium]|nr:hypothetical protein [Leptospiraceae bacterium]
MKVIETKTFRVSYVVPETEAEKTSIQRVIDEIQTDKVPRSEWKIVDNRPKPRREHGA